jgi:hypothetical protein
MTRFKLALMLGFVMGWAVGSGRAQELWRRVRSAQSNTMLGRSMPEPMIQGGFEVRPENTTTRIASA